MSNNPESVKSNSQILDPSDQPVSSDISQPTPAPSINPDSLPPGIKIPANDPSEPEKIQVQPADRFPIFKLKFLIIVVFVILIIAGAAGGYLFYLKQKATYYTFLPDDSQFYLGLSVKKHPQVQKMLELG